MYLLLLVSLIWAFSFGLTKQLAGIDSTAIATLALLPIDDEPGTRTHSS